jgi:hypothetical protein
MQKTKIEPRSVDCKNFIRHVITHNSKVAAERYITIANDLEVCTIKEIDSIESSDRLYEKRMVLFLYDILEEEPLKEIIYLMEKWQKHELICTNKLQPVLPEFIIKNYSVLIQAILSFIPDYHYNLATEHQIVNYFEDLEQEIERLVFSTFKEIQKKVYKINQD